MIPLMMTQRLIIPLSLTILIKVLFYFCFSSGTGGLRRADPR